MGGACSGLDGADLVTVAATAIGLCRWRAVSVDEYGYNEKADAADAGGGLTHVGYEFCGADAGQDLEIDIGAFTRGVEGDDRTVQPLAETGISEAFGERDPIGLRRTLGDGNGRRVGGETILTHGCLIGLEAGRNFVHGDALTAAAVGVWRNGAVGCRRGCRGRAATGTLTGK